ncbi:MAG: NUDIX domain-containing protein [Chlamydiales bacterium]|nr:NUDIX domain-containing protein [Chlamydiales bacterium]
MIDLSYGIIPFRSTPKGWEVLLIQHRKDCYWGFPKGHLEEGEEMLQGAVRELFEETHLTVDSLICDEVFVEHYQFEVDSQIVEKTVTYFAARVSGKVEVQNAEILQARWCPAAEAFDIITYDEAKALFKVVLKKIA